MLSIDVISKLKYIYETWWLKPLVSGALAHTSARSTIPAAQAPFTWFFDLQDHISHRCSGGWKYKYIVISLIHSSETFVSVVYWLQRKVVGPSVFCSIPGSMRTFLFEESERNWKHFCRTHTGNTHRSHLISFRSDPFPKFWWANHQLQFQHICSIHM